MPRLSEQHGTCQKKQTQFRSPNPPSRGRGNLSTVPSLSGSARKRADRPALRAAKKRRGAAESGVADSGGTVKEGIWWCPPENRSKHPAKPGSGDAVSSEEPRGAILALSRSKVLWKTRTVLANRPHLNPDPPLRGR